MVRDRGNARWGLPSPQFALKGRNSYSWVTNIRNVTSPTGGDGSAWHTGACTSFSEPEAQPDGTKLPA